MRVLESVTQLSLGIWIGAMTGFSVTAPKIFKAFGSDRQSAGNLAGEMIWQLNLIGGVLAVTALVALLPRIRQGLNKWRAGLVAVGIVLAAVGAFYIFPQMAKAQPPRPIQSYAENDPVRVNYNKWHQHSRQVFGAAILMGAAAVVLGPLGKE